MSNDLVVYDQRPLQAAEVRAQVNLIQEVMKGVMQKDQHYGVIPGAGNKPTLLKPGAEKLMSTFRLAADPVVEDLSVSDVFRYRVTCRLIAQSTQIFVGAGVGECSSDEEKYKWRSAVSDTEFNATPEDRRRIKYKRDGQINQIRTNPADIANTILKIAKKRALVDAVLTVTGASDIFTQDIEDIPAEILDKGQAKTQEKAYSPNTSQSHSDGRVISEAQSKRFFAISKGTGATNEQIKDWLFREFGFEHSKDITTDVYNDICDRVVKELSEPGTEG